MARVTHRFPICALVVAAMLSAAPVRADDAAVSAEHGTALDNPLAARPLDDFAATRDRPLFTPSRRPFVAPAVARAEAPPPPPPPPPELTFFGTLVDADGASAIVRGGPSEKPVHVHVGDMVGGWKIAKIDDRQIVLSRDERAITFTMFDSAQSPKHTASVNRLPPVLEVNAAGVLRAHRVVKPHQ
jgi:hypothetical protein